MNQRRERKEAKWACFSLLARMGLNRQNKTPISSNVYGFEDLWHWPLSSLNFHAASHVCYSCCLLLLPSPLMQGVQSPNTNFLPAPFTDAPSVVLVLPLCEVNSSKESKRLFRPFREAKLSQLLGKRISTMGRERLEKSLRVRIINKYIEVEEKTR